MTVFDNVRNSQQTITRITWLAIIPFGFTFTGLIVSAVVPRVDEGFSAVPKGIDPVEITAAIEDSPPPLIRAVSFERSPEDDEPAENAALPTGGEVPLNPDVNVAQADTLRHPQLPRLTIDLQKVDSLIRAGDYPFASELLNAFDEQASGLLQVQIRFRRGLCAELVGDSKSALNHYRSLTDSHRSTAIGDAATIASARVMVERDSADSGAMMLMRLLLARERSMRSDLRGDLVHTLANALTPVETDGSLLDDTRSLTAKRIQSPEELLRSWEQLDAGKPIPSPMEAFVVRQLTPSPEGVQVSMQDASSPVMQVLGTLTTKLNWTLKISESDRYSLAKRTVVLDCEDLPLDVVLDVLLNPGGFDWSYIEGQLTVSKQSNSIRDDKDQLAHRLRLAERFLDLAVGLAADHPAAPVSYSLIGSIASRLGDPERALRLLQTSASQFPRSPSFGSTIFNLGKASLLQGDREEALKYFYRTVDRVSGLETDSLAYLFIGRILIENDQAAEAVTPLARGLSLAVDTEYEGPAALLLSAAYLMSGNAAGANAVLLKHREAFESSEGCSPTVVARTRLLSQQAAFLSSLARFWGTTGNQRIREGRALLTTLTNVRASQFFGGHGAYLVGVAFAAIGLDSERDAVFRESLSATAKFPLQNRMRALMTGESGKSDALQQSANAESKIADTGTSDTALKSARRDSVINEAAAAYQGRDYDNALEICQQCLATTTDDSDDSMQVRKAAYRLMGLVYQIQGRHDQAVRCLAGLPPHVETTQPSSDLQESAAQ
jgi:tetratricopeptide (TPR) repeat protein